MIKINAVRFGRLAVATLVLASATCVARANETFVSAGDNTTNGSVSYNGGLGGTVRITVASGYIASKFGVGTNNNVRILFSNLTGAGSSVYAFNAATGVFSLNFGGGAFAVVDNATNAVLLSGSFGSAVLRGTSGATSASLTLVQDSVVYATGTPFFPTGFPLQGSFSVDLVGSAPLAASATTVQAFSANGDFTFSAL